MLSIFQHFHAIPLRSPLISLRSKWRLTGFSRRFTPKNPVRLHKPFGQLPRWGAKNVLPLNLIAFPIGKGFMSGIEPSSFRSLLHRKKGVATRAPSLGRGCRAQRGGVGFLFCGEAASSLPSPIGIAFHTHNKAALRRYLHSAAGRLIYFNRGNFTTSSRS